MELDETWGDKFKENCEKDRNSYTEEKKFLFYIIPKKVIEKLRESEVKGIYSFLEGLKTVYNFSNLNDYFTDDLENLNEILGMLNINELSNGKHTRRIVLEKLKMFLEESKELIQSN